MPFDNFYDESNQKDYKRKIIVFLIGAVFFLPFVFIFLGIFFTFLTANPASEEARKTAEIRERIDQTCQNLPLPVEFNFVDKSFSDNNLRPVTVEYRFRSKRTLADLDVFFRNALVKRGWQKSIDRNHEFFKGEQSILLAETNAPDADFIIKCFENTVSFSM